jgi:plasmid stability protein
MKQMLIRNIPDELHRRVKMAAAAASMTLQDFVLEAMRKEVEKKGKPK